mgnify:CR=1 FL=1|jgi:hypothetical protein
MFTTCFFSYTNLHCIILNYIELYCIIHIIRTRHAAATNAANMLGLLVFDEWFDTDLSVL